MTKCDRCGGRGHYNTHVPDPRQACPLRSKQRSRPTTPGKPRKTLVCRGFLQALGVAESEPCRCPDLWARRYDLVDAETAARWRRNEKRRKSTAQHVCPHGALLSRP